MRDDRCNAVDVDACSVHGRATCNDEFWLLGDDDRQLQKPFECRADQRDIARTADGDDGVGIELGFEPQLADRGGRLFGGPGDRQLEDVALEKNVFAVGRAGGLVRGQCLFDATAECRQSSVLVVCVRLPHDAEAQYVFPNHRVERGSADCCRTSRAVGAAGFDVDDVYVDTGLACVEQGDGAVLAGQAGTEVLEGSVGLVDQMYVRDVFLGQSLRDAITLVGGPVCNAQ